MKEHFLTYEQSLAVKELGFDEPCLDKYDPRFEKLSSDMETWTQEHYPETLMIPAPLKSQFFKWVREKYGCVHEIVRNEDGNHSDFMAWVYIDSMKINVVSFWIPATYEQAEDACINKIIELIKLK